MPVQVLCVQLRASISGYTELWTSQRKPAESGLLAASVFDQHSGIVRSPHMSSSLLFSCWRSRAKRMHYALVVEGLHRLEVIERCGEPTDVRIERRVGAVDHRHVSGHRIYRLSKDGYYINQQFGPLTQPITMHTLTYNFGPNRLMRVLRFDNDLLVDIRQLGYGYR